MIIEKYTFLQIALGIAALNWLAVALKWKILEYITKPATMLALGAYIWNLRPGLVINGNINWLLLAIILSLIGDVFLMLPGDFFIPGLMAFSLTLVAYLLTLTISLPTFNLASILVILIVGLTMHQIYRQIAVGVEKTGNPLLKVLVLGYTVVLSIMVIFALLTLVSHGWENYRALLISAGALLFLVSNIWSGWERFVEPLKFGGFRVMVSYHVGQCLMCLGFLITF